MLELDDIQHILLTARLRSRRAMSFYPFTTPLLEGGGSAVSCRRCGRPPKLAPRSRRTSVG